MTRIKHGKKHTFLIIEEEAPSKCELCGAFKELRPYGPNGSNVCFDCGMKNKAEAERRFEKRLLEGKQ